MVGLLLLIYFFLDWFIPVLVVLYAIAATHLVLLFGPIIRLCPFGKRVVGCSLPRGCCAFEAELRQVVAALLFLALGFVW